MAFEARCLSRRWWSARGGSPIAFGEGFAGGGDRAGGGGGRSVVSSYGRRTELVSQPNCVMEPTRERGRKWLQVLLCCSGIGRLPVPERAR